LLKEWRYKIHDIFEMGVYGNKAGAFFDRAMLSLIILNLIAVAAETVDDLHLQFENQFYYFEIFSVAVFTVEYLIRLWVCIVGRMTAGANVWKIRFKYIFTPMAIVDLLSILPFYLALFFPVADLRFLRLFRLMRLIKMVRYTPALISLFRVIYSERRALQATLVIMVGLLFFSATLGYLFEKEAQPEDFSSIPTAMWWALTTLTTVGYGDVVPVTVAGKLLGGVVMIFGLGLYSIPIGIVASAFSSEIGRRDFVVRYGLVANVPLFKGLESEAITEIANLLRSIVVEDGAVISHKGQVADGLYFLVSGNAVAHIDGKQITVSTGGFFGEISLLHGSFRETTVIAKGTCRLMLLETHDFRHLLTLRPELKVRLEAMVEERLDEFVECGELSHNERENIMDKHRADYSSL
jgi:voltage-gated potassium channel